MTIWTLLYGVAAVFFGYCLGWADNDRYLEGTDGLFREQVDPEHCYHVPDDSGHKCRVCTAPMPGGQHG